jgi:hypothetical protein
VIVDEASMLDVVLMQPPAQSAVPPARTCCWWATWINCPASVPATCCADIIDAIQAGRSEGGSGRLGAEECRRRAAANHLPPGSRLVSSSPTPTASTRARCPRLTTKARDDFFLFKTEDAERAAQLVRGVGHRTHPAPLWHPPGGHPGAQPHAPRGDRRGRAQRAVAGGAQPAGGQQAGAADRQPRLPQRRPRDADSQQL